MAGVEAPLSKIDHNDIELELGHAIRDPLPDIPVTAEMIGGRDDPKILLLRIPP